MTSKPPPLDPTARWIVRGVGAAAALAGAKLGWDFGTQVSGTGLGVVAAVNCAVFGALFVAPAAERVLRWLRPRG